MAQVILVFDSHEQKDELEDALHGHSYGYALQSLDNWLRGLAKYEDKTTVAIDDVRSRIREELDGLPLEL